MAKLYANENFPLPVVEQLRQFGHDVVTIQERDHGGQQLPDLDVVRLATEEGRAVVTFNRKHFINLHRESPGHAGIIVCTVDIDFEGLTTRIHHAICGQASLVRQLIRVNRPRHG